ncbi:MAG: radical SAM protein [Desulfomonilia bacterium]
MSEILLVHPPVSKPCEPPAGLAALAGALKAHGARCRVIDANLEGLSFLLSGREGAADTWTRRSLRHLEENLARLKREDTFRNPGRYIRAVTEIDRVLAFRSSGTGCRVSLSNFAHETLSPVRSLDLLRSAEEPQENVFYPYFSRRLAEALEETAPGVVGFSLNYLSQALTTLAMAGCLRKLAPEVRIVLGGGLVTSWLRGGEWRNPFGGLVDDFVAGPGEDFLLSLAGVRRGPGRCPPDLEPFDGYAYLSPQRVVPIGTASGCYWARCSFCPEKAEANPYSALPAFRAVQDMQALSKDGQPSLIHVCDNAMSPSLLNELAKSGPGAPWYGFARISPQLGDPDFCAALRRSGCVMLKLGIESGDQGVLDALGKGISLKDAAGALKALALSGIGTYVYLLFGTPAENEAAAMRTMKFIEANREHVGFLNLAIFNLPKGSPEARDLEVYDFSQGDLSLYQGFVHPKGWDRKRVRRFLDREFRRSPEIARIVRRDPPSFTSNHAPFFTPAMLGAA